MGTWMSHFRIAEKLLDKIEGLDPEFFAIGNIGPDSGLPLTLNQPAMACTMASYPG